MLLAKLIIRKAGQYIEQPSLPSQTSPERDRREATHGFKFSDCIMKCKYIAKYQNSSK